MPNSSSNRLNEAFIHQFCITYGLYWIDGGGDYVYFGTLQYNPIYYQLIPKLVLTSLPAGYLAQAKLSLVYYSCKN